MLSKGTQQRVVVVGLVRNQLGHLLLCKMSPDRGVFPGQWGLPGGGLEVGETLEEALRRELREEIGCEVTEIKPAFFKDGSHSKKLVDGRTVPLYMIFLLFHCVTFSNELVLNEEFVEYRWVREEEILNLDLNTQTIETLHQIGYGSLKRQT